MFKLFTSLGKISFTSVVELVHFLLLDTASTRFGASKFKSARRKEPAIFIVNRGRIGLERVFFVQSISNIHGEGIVFTIGGSGPHSFARHIPLAIDKSTEVALITKIDLELRR